MPIKSNNPQQTENFDFVSGLSKRQLVEIDACTRCGACLTECPIQDVTGDTSVSPPDKIALFRTFIQRTHGLQARFMGAANISEEELKHFSRAVWECTTCGRCGEMCEAGIFSQRLWPFLRAKMVEMGYGPWEPQNMMEEVTLKTGNVYNQRYSPLAAINRDNVADLEIGWRWKADNFGPRPEFNSRVTPIMVGGVLYATAGYRRAAVAIDAATGETLWVYQMDEGERGETALGIGGDLLSILKRRQQADHNRP